MSIVFRPCPILPSEADLTRFEAWFGFALPADYRAFLREHDGGHPVAPAEGGDDRFLGFRAEAVPPLGPDDRWIAPDDVWDVAVLHGLLREPGEYGGLTEIIPVMRDWGHPAELLPVASQLGNAKYFLCAAGPQSGQILFPGDAAQRKMADGRPVIAADYHRLANTFGDLLDALAWQEP